MRKLYGARLYSTDNPPPELNPKGLLQELIQIQSPDLPHYTIIAETGPAHSRTFHASVTWRGQIIGEGSGRSKKDAEIEAARAAIINPALSSHNQDKLKLQ